MLNYQRGNRIVNILKSRGFAGNFMTYLDCRVLECITLSNRLRIIWIHCGKLMEELIFPMEHPPLREIDLAGIWHCFPYCAGSLSHSKNMRGVTLWNIDWCHWEHDEFTRKHGFLTHHRCWWTDVGSLQHPGTGWMHGLLGMVLLARW